MLKVEVVDTYKVRNKEIVLQELNHLSQEGRFLLTLLERWSAVYWATNEEDSAGRQKAELMDVSSMVDRAVDITVKAFHAIEEQKWSVAVPSITDINNEEEKDSE